jgi:hypothetical protein
MPVNTLRTVDEAGEATPVAPVTLTVVPSEQDAELVCGVLRANGIACVFRKADVAGALTAVLVTGGPMEILVDERELERARELLESAP